MLRFLLSIFLFATVALRSEEAAAPYKYDLCVCAIFKDEALWIKEWLEYHRLVGVQHFFLYNNESTDNYLEVLKPYLEKDVVTLIDWPNVKTNVVGKYSWVNFTQLPAYRDAYRKLRGQTRWLAFIDVDEFIVPITTKNLVKFLKDYEGLGALVINWSCYGPSSYWDIPEDKLMIECLTRKMRDECPHNLVVKSIVQPDYVLACDNPHDFKLVPGLHSVDSNKEPYVKAVTRNFDKIKINHYFTRTLNFFYNVKIPRMAQMNNIPVQPLEEVQWMIDYGNEEKDKEKAIFRFVPALRKRMGFEKE